MDNRVDNTRETRASAFASPVQVQPAADAPISVGAVVEVRRRFDQAWARGFQIAAVTADGYRIRRNSDGSLLPVSFAPADLRQAPEA